MSNRFVRAWTVLFVIALMATLAVGLAGGVSSHWRSGASSVAPTPTNTVAYVEHGRTYYAPPAVAKWYERCDAVFGPLLVCLLVLILVPPIAGGWSKVVKWLGGR